MARDHRLIARAKQMRRQPTPAEGRLWRLLKANRSFPVKFSRQVVVGRCIVDLAARSAKLGIELDGSSHDLTFAYDEQRTADLANAGYRLIRFTNEDVMTNADGVLHAIGDTLSPLPGSFGAVPLPASGERAETPR